MKKLALALLALAAVACTNTNNDNGQQNINPQKEPAMEQKINDVAGRVNFSGKQAVITPMPAIMIATYDENQNPDVMMAAWGGQCGPHHICFNLSPHKTTDNLKLKQAFTASFASVDNIEESDYFGIVSANNVPDKVANVGFTVTPSPNVDAPIINEYPLTLECRVIEFTLTSLNETRVVGEVVNMSADESVLTDGKVDLMKLKPVIFNSAALTYHVVGDSVAQAWGSGKKFQ